jgi:hypothetical protein
MQVDKNLMIYHFLQLNFIKILIFSNLRLKKPPSSRRLQARLQSLEHGLMGQEAPMTKPGLFELVDPLLHQYLR